MIAKLSTSDFQVHELVSEDGEQLQRLLEECADYHELVLGRPPGPAEANAVYLAGPEDGRDPTNKILAGIRQTSERLIGVLDAFRDYPEPGVWYIGLLLFAPKARGSGIGKALIESFAAFARDEGAHELQLNVVEQNVSAFHFWGLVGFSEVRRWRQHLGERDSTFIRMRRSL